MGEMSDEHAHLLHRGSYRRILVTA